MVDIVPPETRSKMMSGIRGQNTKPELIIRKELHRMGFRFRLHDKKLPGKPDIVLPRYRSVIMIHGCFWHRHECSLFKWPSSRKIFWRKKLEGNHLKDEQNETELIKLGWRILVVWECSLKGSNRMDLGCLMDKIKEWIVCGIVGKHEIPGG